MNRAIPETDWLPPMSNEDLSRLADAVHWLPEPAAIARETCPICGFTLNRGACLNCTHTDASCRMEPRRELTPRQLDQRNIETIRADYLASAQRARDAMTRHDDHINRKAAATVAVVILLVVFAIVLYALDAARVVS